MMHTAKQLLLSSRPVSWVNTAYPFAAAYLVITHRADALLIIGSLYFLIPYNLLMYGINDVFDYESDLRNPRKSGMEGIKLRPSLHKATVIGSIALNLPFVVALMLLSSPAAWLVLAVVLFFVVAYSVPVLRFKERPVVDSITSSIHFVGPMVFGLVAAQADMTAAWPYVVAFLLWGMASHAFGAVQDIVADKAAGIGSIATFFGARNTVWFSLLCYAASIVLLFWQQLWITTVIGVALTLYIVNIAPYWRINEKAAESANKAWRRFIYLNYLTGAVVTVCLILWFRLAP